MKKSNDLTRPDPIAIGQLGENIACDFLAKQKYKIIDRNYKCPFGEIDLIAYKNGIFSFIEVKTRRSLNFGQPENSVTKRKQTKMARLAISYLQKKNIKNVACNLGVIAVLLLPSRPQGRGSLKAASPSPRSSESGAGTSRSGKEPEPEITFFENAFLLNDLLPESFNY
ncbi:MAG: YraN family protein [Planctomycetota bacterium]